MAARKPKPREPSQARELLIKRAVEHFARLGFAGARVDEIAADAGINKQLIYHYFGNKEALYVAALEAVYVRIRAEENILSLGQLEPREAMAQLVAFSFDYLVKHPEFVALLIDANRNEGVNLTMAEPLHAMHSPFIDTLGLTLERGAATGVFRRDIDAVNLYISVAGLSYFYFSNIHTLSLIFDKPLSSRKWLAQRRQHVIDFALNALRP